LYPYLAEKMDNSDSIPIMRDKLVKFTKKLENDHPGILFDWTEMNKLPRKNLWFIDILENKRLIRDLLSKISIHGG